MAKGQRIGKLAREWNVGVSTLVEYLKRCGVQVEETPNAKIDEEAILLLEKEFGKLEAKPKKVVSSKKTAPPIQSVADAIGVDKNASVAVGAGGDQAQPEVSVEVPEIGLKVKGKINLSPKAQEETQKPQTGSDGENSLPVVDVLPELRTVEEKEPSVEDCTVEAQGENVTESVSSSETESSEQVVASESSVAAPKESAPIEVVSAERTAKRQLKVVGKIDLEAQPRSRRGKGAQLDKRSSPSSAKPEPVAQIQESKPDLVETVETVAETPVNRVVSEVQGEPEREVYRTEVEKLAGPTVLGKIDLTTLNERTRRRPEASATPTGGVQKRRKRKLVGSSEGSVRPQGANQSTPHSSGAAPDKGKRRAKPQPKPVVRPEISMTDVEDKIKETHARIASKRGSAFAKGAKFRKEKRHTMEVRRGEEMERLAAEGHVLRISEFISVNELAGMMDVPVTDVITTCMNMGVMVSINMRLDAETIALVADEYDYTVEFLSAELDTEKAEDRPEDLRPRTPVFTVLGHVDHGKTSLCDAIRQSNVTAVEKGGITQHLGAYSVELPSGKRMTLIDTPGHEAFTAMRARGAKMTDVAIIVVSAEDGIMPQTIEAINHASVTGARLVFAINKIDSPKANVDKVKEELANHNYLVEEWGGKYQSQDISAKFNQNIDLLLEKVLLEAEMLELTANPFRKAECTVIESFVDKGRGHCANVLVRAGTLRKGVPIVCGSCYGRVKAIYDDKENELKEAGPATPVVVVGLNGAPQAGDTLLQMDSDREAKATAAQIGRIRRTQEMRTRKHITLDEIGRRIAIGNFQELNVIVKGDVDGSVEALSDMLVQLSTEEIQVNVVHRGVGQITETDVTLATTSNAIIVGFQVRPSIGARRMAEAEQVDIRTYSVIYAAHDEIKSAMEGMLSPELKEEVIGTAEVLETFHISKVGTIAGCMVREGKIVRNSKVRIIRDGIVVYTSELATLKRFKDDAKEVTVGMDCGIGIKGYNDIKVGDFFEAFKEVEVKRTLD